MTEIEYVIANFAERFADFREKRIVLHGSRNYAEAIIDNFADSFNFIGIITLDSLNVDSFHGLKVLQKDDLLSLHIDLVILTERVKYAIEAFHDVRYEADHFLTRSLFSLPVIIPQIKAQPTARFGRRSKRFAINTH